MFKKKYIHINLLILTMMVRHIKGEHPTIVSQSVNSLLSGFEIHVQNLQSKYEVFSNLGCSYVHFSGKKYFTYINVLYLNK